MSLYKVKKKKKNWNVILREISKWTEKFFFFFFLNFNFWISRRVFYFVGILRGVRNVFLLGCSQVLSPLNVVSKGISESYQSSIQRREFYYR